MLMTEWNTVEALKVREEEGREEKAKEVAKNALAKGLPVNMVSDITGLSVKAIQSLSVQ